MSSHSSWAVLYYNNTIFIVNISQAVSELRSKSNVTVTPELPPYKE